MDKTRTSLLKSMVSLDLKNEVTDYCYRHDITVSTLIRDLLLRHLNTDTDHGATR